MHTQEALAQEILALRTQQADAETDRMNLQKENRGYLDKINLQIDQIEKKREHFEIIMKDRHNTVEEKYVHVEKELEELRPVFYHNFYDMRDYIGEIPKETVLEFMITLRSANVELKTGLRQLKKAEDSNDSFKEQLPDIRSNIQEMRAYMQEFPMGRL